VDARHRLRAGRPRRRRRLPASWTLIAETAPDKERGKHAGVAQVLRMMGPVIVLAMAFALSPLGILGIKIVFGHLLVVAG
jgi:MFS transporter, SP family, inositol transporter